MKDSHWRLWAAFAVLTLGLAIREVAQISHIESAGGSRTWAMLSAAGWFVFAGRNAVRSMRGYQGEARHPDVGQRIPAGRDSDGDLRLGVGIDLVGQRLDLFLLFVGTAFWAVGSSFGQTASANVVAWTLGVFSWAMLLSLLRSFKFAPRFFISDRGVDCRFVVPALNVGWDEIAAIRSTGTAGKTGWVLLTVTEEALRRFDEKTRRRMERVFTRKGAHYRWADHYCYSSALEVASIVEQRRAQSGSSTVIASGNFPPPPVLADPTPGPSLMTRGLDDQTRAAIVAIAGAVTRVIAYFLPWIVVGRDRVITLNGSKVGAPLLSIWFSMAALAVAVAYLARRRDTTPGLLLGLGIGAVFASLINCMALMETIDRTRSLLVAPGTIDLVPSIGPWVQMVGAIGILAGGIWAVRLSRRDDEAASLSPPSTGSPPAGAAADGMPTRPDRGR